MGNEQKHIIGLDIGGFQIKAVLFKNGRVLKFLKAPTPKEQQKILATIFELIEGLKTPYVKGIGVGAAGAFDRKAGKILRSPNIKALDGLRIKKIIEDKFKLPVRLANDADCFLRAEMFLGAGRGFDSAVGLTLGTGVGGSLSVEGKILSGTNDAAGEFGHMILDIKNHISFEDLCSVKFFKRLGLKDGRGLREKAEKGDKKAKEVFIRYGQGLGVGLANLVNILDPEMIILGGGISKAANFFLPSAKKQIAKLVLSPLASKRVKIKTTRLIERSAAIGAALLFNNKKPS